MRYLLVNESQIKDLPIADQSHVGVVGDFIVCHGAEGYKVVLHFPPHAEWLEAIVAELNKANEEGYHEGHYDATEK